ncbi:MAG: 3'-5' exonuclease [Selenomonadaceae bacterium]|nr:3'-5' exonuclease [Selenomonadaceae bacterium]
MEIKDVLFLDTETTGIPDRAAKWDVDFMEYPHVVQLAWLHGCKAENHIIRPDGWVIPEDAQQVHGITTEYALEHGEPFAAVVDLLIQDCHEAGLICGNNIHFDTGIIKANILRELGREYYDANDVESALYKGKRIDTMRSTMKWVDARFASGRLKFPNLGELYDRCFPGETFDAHDALEDCKAVARCMPVIIENGLVELKVKEYPDEQEQAKQDGNAARIATESAKKFGQMPEKPVNAPISASNLENDKLPVQQEKAPQIENSAK